LSDGATLEGIMRLLCFKIRFLFQF